MTTQQHQNRRSLLIASTGFTPSWRLFVGQFTRKHIPTSRQRAATPCQRDLSVLSSGHRIKSSPVVPKLPLFLRNRWPAGARRVMGNTRSGVRNRGCGSLLSRHRPIPQLSTHLLRRARVNDPFEVEQLQVVTVSDRLTNGFREPIPSEQRIFVFDFATIRRPSNLVCVGFE